MTTNKSIFKKQGIFGESQQAIDNPTPSIQNAPVDQQTIIDTVIPTTINDEMDNMQMDTDQKDTNPEKEITINVVNVVKDMQKGLRGMDEIKKSIPTPEKLKDLLDGTNLDDVNKAIFSVSNIINEIKRILQYKEMELEVLECYLGLEIRNNPVSYGLMDGKTTENSIKSVICNNLNVLTLRRTILNMNYMYIGVINISNVLKKKLSVNYKYQEND